MLLGVHGVAWCAWGIKKDPNEEGIDNIPSLKERGNEAGRKQWNYTKEGEEEQQRKEKTKTRVNKKKGRKSAAQEERNQRSKWVTQEG